ncbi:sodium/proton antiporter (NhaA family) [Hasllibacter halocynthiae]|uniref:Na(+)/H(+) antiporter NhaA n=1 Tax=Hasllibacter halocynthiae TaxID=595589 RepID=A0A2T0XA19_9RHOB|nr:Na+/H+ antiporter NhaA [Hasllibacter halocynthiae]PRY95757.1 sodium/proton antiporter (NhaA family) [Hasllibacter halocynthiae]
MTLSAAKALPPEVVVGNSPGRELIWYDTYDAAVPPSVRTILRSAVEAVDDRTSGTVVIRPAPPEDEVDAQRRAAAVLAAEAQGQGLRMHLAVSDRPGPFGPADAERLAGEIGLDPGRLSADMGSDAVLSHLEENRQVRAEIDRAPGPALLIDGRLYTGALDEAALVEAIERPLGLRIRQRGAEFFQWAAAGGLVLVLATVAALAVVNLGLHAPYEHLRDSVLSLGWNDARFALTLEEWVNDGLMTIFFLIVGIEIKREVVAGELSDPSRAALPIVAALGGMAVPAAIFALINLGEPSAAGWGIPMATDIAFTLGLLALLGDRVPPSLKVFVSALAIADDLGAILVIAAFYSEGIAWGPLGVAAGIVVFMAGLSWGRVYALWPYLTLGILLWAAIHAGGLHATLAGVLTALAIPSRRPAAVHGVAAQTAALMRREAEAAEPGEGFAHHTVERLGEILGRLREPGERLKHGLENWTNFGILPLFAFFNTGLLLTGGAFDPLAPVSLGIILGLVIGKPVGICLAVWLALRTGVATKARDVGWRHFVGAGCLCGIGFTMSIFIAGAAFEGPILEGAKLSVLVASVLSAAIGMTILRLTRPI